MEQLTAHKCNTVNDTLQVVATDEIGAGGAYHRYVITGYNPNTNPSLRGDSPLPTVVLFQNGPINEVGVNGVTHEALLAILIHRMECFQNGDYACDENKSALVHLQAALDSMKARTLARMKRGVEGTSVK